MAVPGDAPGAMFLIRDARREDLSGLCRLARILDTVNLPNDREALREVIDRSNRSFASRSIRPPDGVYLFVLEDLATGRLAGTSMVIAQHGTREAPHVFFEVSEREHYSATLDRHFRHRVLSIGYNYDGPTEIGGLVVDPRYRGKDKPGKQLSLVRFLFIAMHRSRFRSRVLAELLPPLGEGGKSELWEALGRRFTDLDYREADQYSRKNKEFIQQLFPQTDFYVTLLPQRVQRLIGRVGPETMPVRKMLERVGFRYAERIDPFDGGPHFECGTGDIALIRDRRELRLAAAPLDGVAEECLVATELPRGPNRFRAVRTPCRIVRESAHLPAPARRVLKAAPGGIVHVVSF